MPGFDFDEGYDATDPKHSGWAEGMRERADTERKRVREDGPWTLMVLDEPESSETAASSRRSAGERP